MPYRQPIFFNGGYYHIYCRGSEKRTIFLDRSDRERFVARLLEYKEEHGISILCYCLMPNHYHLLVKQITDESVSKFVYKLNLAYAMYFNKKYERVGPLFQGRFKAKGVDEDEYIVHLSRYIHLNPLKLVGLEGLEEYPWSSLKDYLSLTDGDLIDKELILSYFKNNNPRDEYLGFVRSEGKENVSQLMEDLLFEEISPAQVRDLRRAGDE